MLLPALVMLLKFVLWGLRLRPVRVHPWVPGGGLEPPSALRAADFRFVFSRFAPSRNLFPCLGGGGYCWSQNDRIQ